MRMGVRLELGEGGKVEIDGGRDVAIFVVGVEISIRHVGNIPGCVGMYVVSCGSRRERSR